MGSKCKHMCEYKRDAEGSLTERKRWYEDGAKGDLEMLAWGIGVRQLKAKDCWQPWNGFFPRASKTGRQ